MSITIENCPSNVTRAHIHKLTEQKWLVVAEHGGFLSRKTVLSESEAIELLPILEEAVRNAK